MPSKHTRTRDHKGRGYLGFARANTHNANGVAAAMARLRSGANWPLTRVNYLYEPAVI